MRWQVDQKKIVGRVVRDSLDPDAQPVGNIAGRWISPDPLSEEFPSWSPYNYAMNNPVNMIDPDGRASLPFDDYQLSKSGEVTLIKKTDDNFDRVYNEDKSKNIKVDKGVIDKKLMTSKASFFISTNIKQTENIYKFFAKNTNIEWQYNIFQGKNTVATLATSYTEKTIENYAELPSRVLKKSSVTWIYNSHSHPGKFDSETNWPAYPSGYTNDLKYSPEEGDRDYYSLYKREYKERIPSMFNIFVPTRPDIDVNYNDVIVKRTIPAIPTH